MSAWSYKLVVLLSMSTSSLTPKEDISLRSKDDSDGEEERELFIKMWDPSKLCRREDHAAATVSGDANIKKRELK